jgi:hypothetical protein
MVWHSAFLSCLFSLPRDTTTYIHITQKHTHSYYMGPRAITNNKDWSPSWVKNKRGKLIMRSKGVFNAFPKFFRLEATNHSHHQNLGSWGVLFLGEMGILTSDCSQKKWQSSHKKI